MQPNLSVFKNALTNQPYGVQATPAVLVQRVASDKYQSQTDQLRTLTDTEAKATLKKTGFVAVTWSGTFGPTRAKANLQTHSGLICIDLDKLPPNRLSMLRGQLRADEFTHVLFLSPSGNGLKCVVRIDCQSGAMHEAFFRQLSDYYRDCYAITETELDASGKNVDRLCFLPHDPAIFYNADSILMPLAEGYDTPIVPAVAPLSPRPVAMPTGENRSPLERCVNIVLNAVDGQKHAELVKAATLAGGFIAAGKLEEATAIDALEDAVKSLSNVADFNAACRTIRAQIEFGKTRPVVDDEYSSPVGQRPAPTVVPSLTEWPQPIPLKRELRPVAMMEPDMLPPALREWVEDIAHRMCCPLDFTAAAAVVALSSLIGTQLTIKPKSRDDWTVVPNLWGGVVGEPSTLKTPSLSEVIKPLDRLATEARKKFDGQLQRFHAEQATAEAQKKVYQSQEQERLKGKTVSNPVAYPNSPSCPTERRYMTSDATVEKLGELLNENPTGLLQFRDELTGLLSGWERSGREQDRAFYLEAWNGSGGFTVDRISRGTMHVKNVCVSLLGSIQPAKLSGYLQAATGYDNDGFVQRLQLVVYPDKTTWAYVDMTPDTQARNRAYALFEQIDKGEFSRLGQPADEYNKFAYTRFDDAAQAVFKDWLTRLETVVLPGESGLLAEHLTKYRSLMPSIALVFHVVNCFDAQAATALVSVEAATMAVRWCAYLESHARRIYGLLDTISVEGADRLLKEIRSGRLASGFKVREVVQRGWSHLKTTEQVNAAIAELVSRHWLREQVSDLSSTGRPEAATYLFHPSLTPNA